MEIVNVIFLLYLTFLLIVGFVSKNFNQTQEDYLLAGRSLNPWVTALSERASGESAWLLLALPGAAIIYGLVESWTVLGIILGIVSSWNLIAKKLREETEKYNALTIPQYLHLRFDDSSNLILLFSSFIISFFFLFYVSAQFYASGKIFESLFGLKPLYGISLGAFITIFYTLMGGFYAVAWTDFIQGILMLGTLVILPIIGFLDYIQSGAEINNLFEIANETFKNNNSSFFSGKVGFPAFAAALGGLSWGLGYLGQPHLVIRYMAIRSSNEISIAKKIAILWAVPGIVGAFFIGVLSMHYFGVDYFLTTDPEKAMPLLAMKILHPIIAGLFISGAVAAMMSTADSQLLVAASALTQDFYVQYLGKKNKQHSLIRLTRLIIMILGFIAYLIALFSLVNQKKIFGVVSYAWSGLGSSFGPALVMTLWYKKTTRYGIISGLIVGFITTIVWSNFKFLNSFLSERLISFVLAFLAIYTVSNFKSDEN